MKATQKMKYGTITGRLHIRLANHGLKNSLTDLKFEMSKNLLYYTWAAFVRSKVPSKKKC